MQLTIENPVDGTTLELTLVPEDYNGEQGLRVIFPEKDSFVMIEKQGRWEVVDETHINPNLINAIAEGLKQRARYT
jgi:hypothetical protein